MPRCRDVSAPPDQRSTSTLEYGPLRATLRHRCIPSYQPCRDLGSESLAAGHSPPLYASAPNTHVPRPEDARTGLSGDMGATQPLAHVAPRGEPTWPPTPHHSF